MDAPTAARHQVRPELIEQGLLVPIEQLTPHPDNPNNGDEEAIAGSLRVNGQYRPVVTWRRPDADTEVILAGNTTYAAAVGEGWTHLARTYILADTEQEARRILLADNRYARLAQMDQAAELDLLLSLDDLDGSGYVPSDLDDLAAAVALAANSDLDAAAGIPPGDGAGPTLAQRFGVPPFTVLDARSGAWRARKREWMALGIQSELGRDDGPAGRSYKGQESLDAVQGQRRGLQLDSAVAVKDNMHGRTLAQGMTARRGPDGQLTYEPMTGTAGVSVFDPVLCELVYRWHTRAGGHVLDPWAGGSVRGIVAGRLGRAYTGVELRAEQVEANRAQLGLLGPDDPEPGWVLGDALDQLRQLERNAYDLVFGCPPYYGLERYSEDPRDLSNMAPSVFDAAYTATIAEAERCLRPDSFLVLVVGNVRSPGGRLRDLAGLTREGCERAGLAFYNDAILVTPAGSLPVRAGRQFVAGRTLGRTHQYVLVFVKGDRKRATARAGEVDLAGTLAAVEDLVGEAADDSGPVL